MKIIADRFFNSNKRHIKNWIDRETYEQTNSKLDQKILETPILIIFELSLDERFDSLMLLNNMPKEASK